MPNCRPFTTSGCTGCKGVDDLRRGDKKSATANINVKTRFSKLDFSHPACYSLYVRLTASHRRIFYSAQLNTTQLNTLHHSPAHRKSTVTAGGESSPILACADLRNLNQR